MQQSMHSWYVALLIFQIEMKLVSKSVFLKYDILKSVRIRKHAKYSMHNCCTHVSDQNQTSAKKCDKSLFLECDKLK